MLFYGSPAKSVVVAQWLVHFTGNRGSQVQLPQGCNVFKAGILFVHVHV